MPRRSARPPASGEPLPPAPARAGLEGDAVTAGAGGGPSVPGPRATSPSSARRRRARLRWPSSCGGSARASSSSRSMPWPSTAGSTSAQRNPAVPPPPAATVRSRLPGAPSRSARHLLDLVEPEEEFSVAQFQQAAASALASIRGRGHRAVLVGGTGLYHRAVVDGLAAARPLPGHRRRPRGGGRGGPRLVAAFHRRLGDLDPVAASA